MESYIILRRSESMVRLRRELQARSSMRPEDIHDIEINTPKADLELLGQALDKGMTPERGFSLEEASLSTADATDVLSDNDVLMRVPVIPVALIAPLTLAGQDQTALAHAKALGMAWGIQAIGANKSDASGTGVTVAILDTGIEPTHPAFVGVSIEQRNFSRSTKADDEHGHGTHCAGTIFGRDVDGVRIGIARNISKVFIGKVLDKTGHGLSGALARAIEWALANGVNVISMSIGFDYPGLVERLQREKGLPPALAGSKALRAFR